MKVIVALVAAAQAKNLISLAQTSEEMPDLWDENYNDTWKYSGHEHIVSEADWIADAPKEYTVAQLRKKPHHKKHHKKHHKTHKKAKHQKEAVALQIPEYTKNGYSDGWQYSGHDHLVNETEWIAASPKDTMFVQENMIPKYWENGYSDGWQYSGHDHLVNETEWIAASPKETMF